MRDSNPANAKGAERAVEIRVLGGFGVTVDGSEVPARAWPSARAAQLVQLLSLADGRRLLRDQVLDALWPQLSPPAGAANLRKAAHHARRALRSDEAIVLRGGQVLLWPSASLTVDAERFERVAETALAGGDPAECANAASAYGGEL
ncbi:MAG: AfsR/SARP family transcriptional regulator, partial [Pseudomonadota bacterium]